MPRISPTAHGIADYATGTLLLVAPGLAGARDPGTRMLLRGVGATVLGEALVTDWNVAPIRRLPVRMHLIADAASGAALVASPWLLGLRRRGAGAWAAPVVVGLVEAGVAALPDPPGGGLGAAGAAPAGAPPAATPTDPPAAGSDGTGATPSGSPTAVRSAGVPGSPDEHP